MQYAIHRGHSETSAIPITLDLGIDDRGLRLANPTESDLLCQTHPRSPPITQHSHHTATVRSSIQPDTTDTMFRSCRTAASFSRVCSGLGTARVILTVPRPAASSSALVTRGRRRSSGSALPPPATHNPAGFTPKGRHSTHKECTAL